MRSKCIAALTAAILLTTNVAVQADSDKNMQIMLKAARSLDFSEMGNQEGNRAYLLTKHTRAIPPAEVGVAFVFLIIGPRVKTWLAR
jgi:hypothetical protein